MATFLVQATTDALAYVLEHDETVNTEELSALIDQREQLESDLRTLQARIDDLRRTPPGDE